MVVLDQFYQILEKETTKISPFWKVAHTATCIASAVCGFLTAFAFGSVLDDFDYNCVLNSDLLFDNSTLLNTSGYSDGKKIRAIDITESTWGLTSDCNFAQFTPLVIFISAVIWGTYFAIMAKGGGGYSSDLLSRPWTILYPCIFFTAIFIIVYIVSTVHLQDGLTDFCNEFRPEFNNTGCVPEINVYTKQFHDDHKVRFFDFYTNSKVAIVSSRIGIWSWVLQALLCVLRVCCVTDFDLQLVTVMTKDEEKIENVVEFAELDDIDEVSDV